MIDCCYMLVDLSCFSSCLVLYADKGGMGLGGGGVVRQEKKMKVTRVFHTNKGDGKTSYEKERKKKSIF